MGSAAASFIHTYLQCTHSLAMEGSMCRKDTYVQITLTNIPLVHTMTSWTHELTTLPGFTNPGEATEIIWGNEIVQLKNYLDILGGNMF